MRKHFRILVLIFLIVAFPSCTLRKNSDYLQSWDGKYFYEEEPIRAIAGYYMVMEWKLNINKETDKYIGSLEVNGQQTYMNLQSEIVGNKKMISLIYIKRIDGSSENLKPGDTLFNLRKEGNRLLTSWGILKPRLPENPPKECWCFEK